ncbi:MAG: 1-acyl-sn-glycerol-3-phosphate acyltransferase [Clostridia bacterium]|nr:1-acyl-sn-glycerol-3-phosphate acyltransferase [Clostridia bacterium]
MEQNQKQKRSSWILPRHRWIQWLAKGPVGTFCRWKTGVKVEPFKAQGDRNYLVLMNHQTVYDQFFVGMAFRGPVYYLATEDIFSNGWISSLLRFAVNPIPIKKQTLDLKAVKTCLQVVREGGTLALAPEGNRTYSGRTEYMNPSIAKLARKMGLPIALFRIEEGYGIQPRWAENTRKGKMRAAVTKVLEPEVYQNMTDEELFAAIEQELMVDEARVTGQFRHQKLAEYLERAIYVCPNCGLAHFESSGDTFTCLDCGAKSRYLPSKELEGDFPFRFVAEWYDWQKDFINRLDPAAYTDTPMYEDTARLSEVIVYKAKKPLWENARIRLYGDRILMDNGQGEELRFPFEETDAVIVLGRNKLNVYHGGKIYQLKGGKRFNALKYVHIFHRWKNVNKGDGNGKFLGL